MTEWNRLQYLLLRMIIGITWWSLKKIHRSIFEYLNNKVGLKIGTVKLLKNLHTVLIDKK